MQPVDRQRYTKVRIKLDRDDGMTEEYEIVPLLGEAALVGELKTERHGYESMSGPTPLVRTDVLGEVTLSLWVRGRLGMLMKVNRAPMPYSSPTGLDTGDQPAGR